MTQEERRAEILALLEKAVTPLTGAHLSNVLGVTRQIIVGDVAVLRARGEQIVATPRGYFLNKAHTGTFHRSTIAVRHGSDNESLAQELNLVVDLGGTVLDVTVEHPLYGELTANLQLSSREDVTQFIERMEELQAEPLLVLTGGYHLHRIEAPTSEAMGAIRDALRKAGYLAE
ncbi:MAG TPA: transcription repressor NadR [Firmicutes bacterium]|nr:transcription repressor NadR [Bacillota bacterium]